MAARKDFEIFLYKNKFNENTLLDIIPMLSIKTIKYILRDLELPKTDQDKNTLYVFTDGNVRNNGKKKARGGYSIYFGDSEPYKQFNKTELIANEPTNNKAELYGVESIMKVIRTNQELFKNKKVIVCTDSKYSIDCITKWSEKWKVNNWVNSKNEPVKNKETIQSILDIKNNISHVEISFKHIFSHTKEPTDKSSFDYFLWYGNNEVDTNINKMLDLI